MNFLRKNKPLKIVLLLLLSLRVGMFVFENYTAANAGIETVSIIDFDDSENEEKELEENNKIVESLLHKNLNCISTKYTRIKSWIEVDTSTYLEYTTPPPEYSLS